MSKHQWPPTLPYPKVMSEIDTVRAALAGRSIARLGDGELRLADGGASISQVGGRAISFAMLYALAGGHGVLTCIPHMQSPKYEKTWCRYNMDKYIRMYRRKEYGSAFITRPDSAPWIDTPEYWDLVEQLWAGKDITLVISEEHTSLRPEQLESANSIRLIEGPRRDAYERINDLMEAVGPLKKGDPVILCLGACATVMAIELHKRYEAHALDLGHIGRMIRHKGKGKWSGSVSANVG